MEKAIELQNNFEITVSFLWKVRAHKQPACTGGVSYNRFPQTVFQQALNALNVSITESPQF